MQAPSSPQFPERMDSFLTTEHFTLQSARAITNGEIMSRVTIYFTTLSSVLIAAAFLAQLSTMDYIFTLFTWIAFPVAVLLGIFTLARLMVLTRRDFEYIRAINRIRYFYIRAAPEAEQYLRFPAHDDARSARAYGGYSTGFRGNLLSAAHAVNITNSVVATVLLSTLISRSIGLTTRGFVPYGLGIFVFVYVLHGLLAFGMARTELKQGYRERHLPAGQNVVQADTSAES